MVSGKSFRYKCNEIGYAELAIHVCIVQYSQHIAQSTRCEELFININNEIYSSILVALCLK